MVLIRINNLTAVKGCVHPSINMNYKDVTFINI